MMPIGKDGIKRICLYTTALILAVALLSPVVIPPLINSKAVRTRIAGEIKSRTGLAVSPEQVQMVLTPLPGLRLTGLSFDPGPGIRLTLETLGADLNLSRLLYRQLTVDRIFVQNPRLEYLTGPSDNNAATGGPAATFSPALPGDALDRLFTLFPKHQEKVVLDITDAKTPYFGKMDAQITAAKISKTLEIQTRIQDLDLDLPNLPGLALPTSLPSTQVQVPQASLSFTLDNQGNLIGKLGLDRIRITIPEKLKQPLGADRLDFEFSLSKQRQRVVLKPGRISFPGAEVGTVFNRDLATDNTDITFTGRDVDIAQAREVCLPLLGGMQVSDRLFDILRGGRAVTISVGFTGPSPAMLFDPDQMIIKGEAASARVKIPRTPLIAEGVGARVTMAKGILHIEPTQGQVRGSQILDGVLDIDLGHRDEVPFSGTFSLDSQLDNLPQTLSDLLPGTRLAQEMARISQVSGSTRAVLGLSLPRGHQDLAVTVRATDIQAKIRYGRIPMPVGVHAGTFTLDQNKIVLTEMAGRLGASPFDHLNAAIILDQVPRLDLKSATGRFMVQDFMPWARSIPGVMALIHPAKSVAGTLVLDSLTIDGPMFLPHRWQFSATGSGQDMVIGFDKHPRAFESVSGMFDISQDHISATGIDAVATDIGWLDFSMDSSQLTSLKLPLTFHNSRVDKKEELTVHADMACPDGPSLSFDLNGPGLGQLAPTLVVLKDPGMTDALILPYADPEKPRFSFEGRIDTRTLEKILITGSPVHKALTRLTRGEDFTLATGPDSNLHLETGKLNLDVLFPHTPGKTPQTGQAPMAANQSSRPLLANKTLFFKADELTYRGRRFENVDARITFHPESTRIDIGKAGLCGLGGKGEVIITYGSALPHTATRFSVTALNQENINTVMSCLFKADDVINGAYSFAMDISGTGTSDTLAANQAGTLSFKAESGRINKATLLSRVLSVINIIDPDIRQKGFAYKSFTLEAEIKESVIHLKKAYIDAENMAVLASGWVDPLNDKLDLIFLVAPFKTIDALIKMIPVVNTLLKGRIASFPARASGPISDPLVVPLAPSAVGKGLVDMLTDLVKAPVRLFQENELQ